LSKLLVCGCSWSDPNFKTVLHPYLDTSWPKWPELLEGPWDKIVNLSRGGSGLDLQVPLMMKYIMLNDDVSHIIYQLSSWHRWTTPSGYRQNPSLARSKHTKRPSNALKQLRQFTLDLERMEEIENLFPTNYRSIELRINNSLILLNALIDLCLYKNIKFIGWQGIQFSNLKDKLLDTYAYKCFIRHELFHKLDELHNWGKIEFINWPLVDNMADSMDIILPKTPEFRVSTIDAHPNKNGQKFIAQWIHQNATTI